ncbi:MAG: type II secretion system protein [Tissierellia bacterium]|nr:type II secretion system protein [Tissierellia bacterium]
MRGALKIGKRTFSKKGDPGPLHLSAYSLMELVVVLGIICLLLGMALFRFGLLGDYEAKRDLDRLVADAQTLRRYAIENRQETALVWEGEGYRLDIDGKTLKKEEVSSGLVYLDQSNLSQLHFSPSGKPSQAGRMVFSIGKTKKEVVLRPVSGRILLREVDNEKGL